MNKSVLKQVTASVLLCVLTGCENLTETKFKQSVSCEAANVARE